MTVYNKPPSYSFKRRGYLDSEQNRVTYTDSKEQTKVRNFAQTSFVLMNVSAFITSLLSYEDRDKRATKIITT